MTARITLAGKRATWPQGLPAARRLALAILAERVETAGRAPVLVGTVRVVATPDRVRHALAAVAGGVAEITITDRDGAPRTVTLAQCRAFLAAVAEQMSRAARAEEARAAIAAAASTVDALRAAIAALD